MSWEEAWQQGRTGWDAGQPAPALLAFLEKQEPVTNRRALVPGCGTGYDAFALAQKGYTVHGLDIAPTAASRFHAERERRDLSEANARILTHDFFSWEPPERYDLIWDYTFLCAIEPEMRPAWVERMARYLAQDGVLVTLIFPVDPDNASPSTSEEPGPPYRLHPDFVTELLAPEFERTSLEEVERSHPGREGKEWLACWRRRKG